MELGLDNDLIIQCDECGLVHIIDKNSLDVNTYSYERNMGAEIEYDFVGECCCEKCGNSMSYIVRAYEYPVGALNYEDYESLGCTFVQTPSISVDYYEFDMVDAILLPLRILEDFRLCCLLSAKNTQKEILLELVW